MQEQTPNPDKDTNVTKQEKELLEDAANSTGTEDDQQLKKARLDETDDDGEPLNEDSDDLTGEDLDVPDDDEQVETDGDSDEENSSYSLNDDKEDDINTRQ
ncbi:hypothetical protein JMG10_06455 [Nostoc ellipsosporum NOK]|nr:hypothetical protein [Nostoc ellipsosporum NOK]